MQWKGWEHLFDVANSRILAGHATWHGVKVGFRVWFTTGLVADRRERALLLGQAIDGVQFTPVQSWQPTEPDPRWYQVKHTKLHNLAAGWL